MQVKLGACMALAAAAFASCQTSEPVAEKAPVVQPPLADVAPHTHVFTCNPVAGDTLLAEDGTTIVLPAQALVDAAGVPVNRTVEVHYTPVNDRASLLASGIPMSYSEPGAAVQEQFESAGMFELRAFVDGEPVFIAPDKALQVSAPSNNGETDFGRFFLNEDTGSWEYTGVSQVTDNPRRAQLAKEVAELDSLVDTREDLFALSLMGAVDVWMDSQQVGYQNKLERQMSTKLKKRGVKYYSYHNQRDVYFNGRKVLASYIAWKNLDERPLPKGDSWQAELNRLGKTNNYRLTLTNWNTGEKRIRQVRAQHRLKDLFAADATEWFKEYEEWTQRQVDLEAQIEASAEFMRSFQVRAFGIHNADRFTKTEFPTYVNATFSVDGDTALASRIQDVYFIERDRQALVKFNRWGWHQMCLDTLYPGTFVAVLPGGELATYSAEDFEAHPWPEGLGIEALPTTFPLRKSPKAGSIEELAEIM